jgi:hypothetical protein
MTNLKLVALFLLACGAWGQQAPAVFEGSWTASAGQTAGQKDIFRGRWSGQALPNAHNSAHGSWTLLNEKKDIVLQGTWSARKSPAGWHGTFSAQALRGRSSSATWTGTWTADTTDFTGKTLEEMLQRAAEKQIAGSWQSGRMQGNWWLQKLP